MYVRLSTYIQQRLPAERRVYVIDSGNKTKDITIKYYLVLFLYLYVFNKHNSFLVEYRNGNSKKLVSNESIFGAVQRVRKVQSGGYRLKVPIIGYMITINGVTLGYDAKKNLLSHDRDDNLSMVYMLQTGEELDRVVVELKGHAKSWKGGECKRLTIGDVVHLSCDT
jgi:hypothetical protein